MKNKDGEVRSITTTVSHTFSSVPVVNTPAICNRSLLHLGGDLSYVSCSRARKRRTYEVYGGWWLVGDVTKMVSKRHHDVSRRAACQPSLKARRGRRRRGRRARARRGRAMGCRRGCRRTSSGCRAGRPAMGPTQKHPSSPMG